MRYLIYFIAAIFLCSCEGPKARKPIRTSSPQLIKSTVERNKELLDIEMQIISALVKK